MKIRVMVSAIFGGYLVQATIAEGEAVRVTSFPDDLQSIGDAELTDGRHFFASSSVHIVPV